MRKYTPEQQIAAFWEKVDTSAGIFECWIWRAELDKHGYGRFGWRGQMRFAHRVSYEIANGVPPGRLCVLHSCDNPCCVNPLHLWLGTHAENMRDMREKGRANTPIGSFGERHPQCRLSVKDVEEIRQSYKEGTRAVELSQKFGVSLGHVHKIIRGAERAKG